MVISINKAEYLGEYMIRFFFSDQTEQLIDFSDFLNAAKNPMTRKYLDIKSFENFTILYGDIMWNDFEMCFPIGICMKVRFDPLQILHTLIKIPIFFRFIT